MKNFLASLLVCCSASTLASEPRLLERALSCSLKDGELPSLMRELAVQQPTLARPIAQYGAPSADVYRLSEPFTALGYSSAEIVVTPARILLAIEGETMSQAIRKLKLEEAPYSPARRSVRPTVSIVAFQLSHKTLQNKLLVGCEYANAAAGSWVR